MLKKTLRITLFCIIFSLPLSVQASLLLSSEEEESLIPESQKRCEHLCMNVYRHFDTKKVQSYRKFYHPETGRCFMLISNKTQTERYLLEIEEQGTVIRGIFIQNGKDVDFCIVSPKIDAEETDEEKQPKKSYTKCKSKSEWDKFTKPYLEE